MTPRPRKKGSRDLPSNLYASKKNGKTYYQYRHPETGKFTGFGTNKQEAVLNARQLNQIMVPKEKTLAQKVMSAENPLDDYLDQFKTKTLPAKRINGFLLSKKTVTEYSRVIKNISKELGHYGLQEITQKNIAEFLNTQSTAETFNKYRSMLVMVFKQAVSDGLVKQNLPEKILKRDKEQVKRERLTLETYQQIYQHARPAIQNAMELSLNALQRRQDIQNWRFDAEKDSYVYIIQSKTHKHGKSAYLRIPIALPLVYSASGAKTIADIIKNCRDKIACPFLVHEKRQRRVKSKEKQHMLQLSVKQISDGFAEARTLTGIKFTDYPPTFHELLSLGEHLRQKSGWTIEQIQTLKGHTSDKMTRKYLEGHEWTTVDIRK